MLLYTDLLPSDSSSNG